MTFWGNVNIITKTQWEGATMANEHFVDTGKSSFFGEYVYDRIVPRNHFLRKLKEIIPWERFTQRLIGLYKGEGLVGRPPFDPAVILKMELVAYLYNLSERQVEVYLNENLPAKYFVGLAVDEPAPDHSTLTVFRERLVQRGREQAFAGMLEEIIQIALQKGIQFGAIQIVDSVHTVANVNSEKDEKRQGKGKGPRDPDAHWGYKQKRKVKNEEGKEEEQTVYFFGYKAHVSLNAETGLITSLETTSGEANDGQHFIPLVEHDRQQKLGMEVYAADKAYDDGQNHYHLDIHGLYSAIHLKDTRTHKKDPHKQVWLDLQETPQYQQGLEERYKIERKFGEAKQGHGLGRCRYLGKMKYTIQAFFTAMVLNLKRMVKILCGVGFKTQAAAG